MSFVWSAGRCIVYVQAPSSSSLSCPEVQLLGLADGGVCRKYTLSLDSDSSPHSHGAPGLQIVT